MRSFKQLLAFVEVVNRNGFAAAARALAMTPAAISKLISSLEEDLGVQLLRRSTRRIELTPEGALYFSHAKQILASLTAADAEISQALEEPSGLLKVICGPHFGSQYLLPHLAEFLSRYPKLRLDIELTQIIPDLEKEKIDLILGLSTAIPAHCVQRRLILARQILCAAPAYLEKYGVPEKPSDLTKHAIITHSKSRPNDALSFKNGETVHFEPLLYFNDTRAMRSSALAGIGIVALHDYIVQDAIKQKSLVEILGKYREQKKTIPLFVAYPQTGHLHKRVRCLIDFVLEKI